MGCTLFSILIEFILKRNLNVVPHSKVPKYNQKLTVEAYRLCQPSRATMELGQLHYKVNQNIHNPL